MQSRAGGSQVSLEAVMCEDQIEKTDPNQEVPYWEKNWEEMTEEEREQMARDHQDGIDALGIPEGANYLGAGEYTFAPVGD